MPESTGCASTTTNTSGASSFKSRATLGSTDGSTSAATDEAFPTAIQSSASDEKPNPWPPSKGPGVVAGEESLAHLGFVFVDSGLLVFGLRIRVILRSLSFVA